MNNPAILPPSRPEQRTGIDCPQCKVFIDFRIEDLLRRSIFRCKHCGLELTLNRFQSRDSLEALTQMQGALEQLNAVKRRYSENPDGQ
jgi:transposase-like protein